MTLDNLCVHVNQRNRSPIFYESAIFFFLFNESNHSTLLRTGQFLETLVFSKRFNNLRPKLFMRFNEDSVIPRAFVVRKRF